jgi:glycerate kinase
VTRRLLAAPDKFRGTASAPDLAAAMVAAAGDAGWTGIARPVSDGGEGLVGCFGGPNRTTVVPGPLGVPVRAGWRLDGDRAVVETASASGLSLVEGRNDALAADTRGIGELIAAAIAAGAREIVVGAGGSASTDGGMGAVEVLAPFAPFDGRRGPRLVVAADVTTRFLDAARLFAPQKGADEQQVAELSDRLRGVAATLHARHGIDITGLAGSGAAGGLAGGLAALGARIRPGFDVVAEQLRLGADIGAADLVASGEGRLDATSLLGKAPIGICRLSAAAGIPCVLVAGTVADDLDPEELPAGSTVISLTARFGAEAATTRTLECVFLAVREWIDQAAH